MEIRSLFSLRFVSIVILCLFLVFSCQVLWHLYHFQSNNDLNTEKYSMFINTYKISRSNQWKQAFSQLQSNQYHKTVDFVEKGPKLIILDKYIAEIGYEDQHYEEQTINSVIQLSALKQGDQSPSRKHFLVKSEINQQLFYLPLKSQTNEDQQGNEYQKSKLKKCLQLDNIELKSKLQYFVDHLNNFWLLSHPHNNVLFVQVYDCQKNRLVRKILHEPEHNGRKYLINELIRVDQVGDGLYEIKALTYESHKYGIVIDSKTYDIKENKLTPSHHLAAAKLPLSQQNNPHTSITYTFIDPASKLIYQQFYHLLFSFVKNYFDEIKILLGGFGVSAKQLETFLKQKLKEYELEKQPEYFDYDIQAIDETNDCLLNLQYHLDSEKQTNSSITRLANHLLDTRTPVFHDFANYDKHDIVEILKNQKTPKINEFKRLQIDKGFQKQYKSLYFYSVYPTYPNSRVHFLGLGEKIFYLHPTEAAKHDDYLHVRSKTGGIVLQGSKIKGLYEDRNLSQFQVTQNFYIESNQVIPGIWQAHAGYQSLYSVYNNKTNKVQLINGLSGKVMLSFVINIKQGYEYTNSYLFNNQWWIVLFNKNTLMSELVKHELYVEKQYPKQIDAIKRVYGKIVFGEFGEGEDDLRQVFEQYSRRVSKNGILILDLFRCLDEFYYIQICDTKGQNYAIVRIHYKRFSNRLPKNSGQYSSDLQQRLIIEPKKMVKEKQKIDSFLLVLEGRQFYENIFKSMDQQNFNFKNYSFKTSEQKTKIVNSLKKLHQFEVLPYAVISHQLTKQSAESQNQQKSIQQVFVINMRVLVENAKKRFMLQTKTLARNRLFYLTVFLVVILISLIVKMALNFKLEKIQEEKTKQIQNLEASSPQKAKNKKQKTK